MKPRNNKHQSKLELDHQQRDWASLPLDLLKICLSAPALKDDDASRRAALASCKAFASAVVRTSPHALAVNVDRRSPPVTGAVRIWAELWGDERPLDEAQNVRLAVFSRKNNSPERCLNELLSAAHRPGRLAFVRELVLEGLELETVLVPPGLSALLPNLQTLTLDRCVLTPPGAAARTTTTTTTAEVLAGAGCSLRSTLRRLHIDGLSLAPTQAFSQPLGGPLQWAASTAHLKQLARLPALADVALKDSSCPTLFLVALGTQLTRLELHHSYRQLVGSFERPALAPAWRATLEHVARCTRLEEVTIPCATAEELRVVAPALDRLRRLKLITQQDAVATDGDAMARALLGLPRLASLRWSCCAWSKMRRWYNDWPCRWEELFLGAVSPGQLGRLPLGALPRPVRWWCLMLDAGTSIQEVRAAVANATRRCRAGFSWDAHNGGAPQLWFVGGARGDVDVPAFLPELRPLMAPLTELTVICVRWDAATVRALGEALPRTCTRLALRNGALPREGLEQMALSLPWVRRLELRDQDALPEDVAGYVRLARRLKREEGGREVRLEEVVVAEPRCPAGVPQAKSERQWEQAVRAVKKERGPGGGGGGAQVVLTLEVDP